MRIRHRLLVVALCCAALAWIAGPVGRLLVVLPLLLFGPGYLLERACTAFDGTSLAARPALWLGLSISLIALIYEWTTALGLALTIPVLYALAAACGIGVIWRNLRYPLAEHKETHVDRATGLQPANSQRATYSTHHITRWTLALLAILALTFWTRFSQIDGLALPPWVDSVHHALMIRVAAESGQAPTSLRPYMPVDQLPYHWGYHVVIAAVMQLTSLALERTMLWSGQVLNALQALVAAALAAYLWRRPLAGVVAALVVGLLSIMPAYYLSWGRYTQLTGLLLLPPLMIAWRELLRGPSRGRLACLAVLLAGLSLVHFRILLFALAYLATSGLIEAFAAGWATGLRRAESCPPRSRSNAVDGLSVRLGYTAAVALLAVALATPWMWPLVQRMLLPVIARPSVLVAGGSYNAVTDGLLWAGHNRVILALALATALWGVARRRRAAAELALWLVAMTLIVNPTLVGLPYTWLITNDVLIISLYLPASVLIGGGAGWLVESIERRWIGAGRQSIAPPPQIAGNLPQTTSRGHRFRFLLLHAGVGVALTALALRGAWELRSVVNPETILATQADATAIAWAAAHTPADARFLVGATPWLNVYRGTDGGWWLLPLAGRWTNAPPVLYIYGTPDYIRAVDELNKQVAGLSADQPQALYALIKREHISYIYIGSRPGPIAREAFASDPAFEKVYEHDGVTILAVRR
jgi:hypothetical protein